MKAVVVFDSQFGNTEEIARAVSAGLEAIAIPVSEAVASDLMAVDLLVVGSPTQGGKATPAVQKLLRQIPADGLKGVMVAAFDTRMSRDDQGFALRALMGVIGFAAGRIGSALKARGGNVLGNAEGFIVIDKEGPLKAGEAERAADWGRELRRRIGEAS